MLEREGGNQCSRYGGIRKSAKGKHRVGARDGPIERAEAEEIL